jgi:hypothetical protein
VIGFSDICIWISAGIWRRLLVDGSIYRWILSGRPGCGLITS